MHSVDVTRKDAETRPFFILLKESASYDTEPDAWKYAKKQLVV